MDDRFMAEDVPVMRQRRPMDAESPEARIRHLQTLVNDPRFDREAFLSDLHVGRVSEPEAPFSSDEYEAMREQKALDDRNRARGMSGLYHPEGHPVGTVMPSDIRRALDGYGSSYLREPERPAGR